MKVKKEYVKPTLKNHGLLRKLTLKAGSGADGGFLFEP